LVVKRPAIEAIDAYPAQKRVEFFDAITSIVIVKLIAIIGIVMITVVITIDAGIGEQR
jgi:hypothetical protein